MADDPYVEFRDELLDAGLLIPTGVEGLYGRSAGYQNVVDAFCRIIPQVGGDQFFEPVHFPPVLAREVFDRTDYLRSFPDLMGSVHVFHGDDRKHAQLLREVEREGDWAGLLDPADVVLCSATCHPVYPLCSGRHLPPGGRRFEIHGYCFRHEPSPDPARMQAFHMHELVFIGTPADAMAHRDAGLERGLQLLRDLGLEMDSVPANDPFFGRLGTMLAANQLEDALKLEGVTPICSVEKPTAVMSGNYHGDHFGTPFEIQTADGETAHSSCVAFGVDRITLALLHAHGLDPGMLAIDDPRASVPVRLELLPIDPSTYERHALHAGDGIWIETNCYADFWIEALHAFGFDPVAGLGFTLSSDFDGDQWTMFKFPNEDLRDLYGLRVNELNVWRPLAQHVAEQIAMGHLLTIDADAWFLPDTTGITYHAEHQKTTLAAQMIDLDGRRLGYFHNAAYYELGGDDFDGLFGIGTRARPDVLPPYVETVRFAGGHDLGAADLTEKVVALAHSHVSRAPTTNPLGRMKKQIESDRSWLAGSDLATFHRYAFGTCRQCGANAELAAAFVRWLDVHDGGGLSDAIEGLLAIATGCKALEFGLARVVRGRTLDLDAPFAVMEDRWDSAMTELTRRYGR